MAKKQDQVDKIVETEPVVVNENDIVSGEELKETDVIDVNAPEVIIEAKAKAEEEAKAKAGEIKLKVLIAFTDKYTHVDYVINDEISVDKNRAKELLDDPRRLVEKVN